ncbi:hypothetical protein LSH36_394g01062 [Paralvinella palmiformis]|uniref:Cytochrome P450 n=1 Tax=Paralvinella palmiformis TaxID=53620 RepID=A0AAD9N1F1_9ANNE|nr:hypothetical protein LSH36_394g01062 [Paralvinella palmiformis]
MDLDIWLVGLTIFLLAYKYLRRGTGKKLPPGPLSFPVIGSPSLLGSSDIRKKLIKMAKQYGDVFTIFLGSSRVVVLNGYDAIYDAFAKNARVFSGRPKTFHLRRWHKAMVGVISTEGPFWREQRRHAQHILRDFGFGRTILEDRILEEVDFFVQYIEDRANEPLYPVPLLRRSVANVIASVTFGKRMEYEDPVFVKYMEIFNRFFRVIGYSGVVRAFQFVRMHHRLQLPFTEACVLETQRLGDIAPFGVPHAVTEDTEFRGYFIPKDTEVFPNMYSVHMAERMAATG